MSSGTKSPAGHKPVGGRKKRRKLTPKKIKGYLRATLILSTLVGMIVLIAWLVGRSNAYAVYIGDKEIGSIKIAKSVTIENLESQAKERLTQKNGTEVSLAAAITLKKAHVAKAKLMDKDKLAAAIDMQMPVKVKAVAIKVDGSVIAMAKSQTEVAQVKERILTAYSQGLDNLESSGFAEQISTEDVFVSKNEIWDEERLFALLTTTTTTNGYYTAEPGDSLSAIAVTHNMTLARLLEMNPDVTVDDPIRIGQVFNVEVSTPLLSVRTVQVTKKVEVAEAPLQFVTNPDQDRSYQKVLQEGKAGQREVEVRVTRLNGVIESSQEVVSRMLVEPQARIEEVGAK
ncbi:MAG: G5 domain-containing protein [Clostridiales bacterium]|jgi:LysM repeat protein|nr:G5 domain-containing protein [Clostridiales bacterium]